jgi:ribosomal protein S18 acetylase RimI-like enzyme
VITYRRFRNTDPPALVEIWNESLHGRGSYPVRNPSLFERWIFSKPYFVHDDITVAVDDETGKLAGFSLSGFAPNESMTALSVDHGVICAVLVRPEYRKRGVGTELTRRADEYLRGVGATIVSFGSMWPDNPYLFGVYGGSNSPGILASTEGAAAFVTKLGYTPADGCRVFHKKLDTPLTLADPRFPLLRKRYEPQVLRTAEIGTWWEECIWGVLEPVELRLTDKLTGIPAGRALVWELEGFGWKWNVPAAGIIDVQVRPGLRRQGLGKLLVAQVLRFLQDQFFAVVELQAPTADPAASELCRSLGFEQVDEGFVYRKPPG